MSVTAGPQSESAPVGSAGAVLPIISLRGIVKRFAGVKALDDVDFDLRPGEVHGLVGENGAGKSTISKILAGVYGDYDGEMRVAGEVRRFSSPRDAQADGIGMVYQELSTFSHLTVAENIFGRNLPRRGGFVSWRATNQIAKQHLHELGLDIDVTSTMGTLPVGQQQLIEIARVIFSGARSIILDEPTSALSAPETRRLFAFIRALKEQGKSLVFISHFLDDVLEISDRVTVFKNGRRVTTRAASEVTKHDLVTLMIGADSTSLNRIYEAEDAVAGGSSARSGLNPADAAATVSGPEVLRVTNLTKYAAFTDVSLSVRAGEILGVFAFMGAGQTQLGRCLFGAEPTDSGSIHVGSAPIRLTSTTRARAAGIAFVPEDRRHALMMSQEIFKNITVAHLGRLLPWWLREAAELSIAEQQIKNVGVRPPKPRLAVGGLSGGNQQKVVLAKWLTQKPRVLILIEPTRGMDVGAKEEVLTVIRRLREEGVAILVITTEPETLLSVANRGLVMRKGRITAELAARELTKENLIKNA